MRIPGFPFSIPNFSRATQVGAGIGLVGAVVLSPFTGPLGYVASLALSSLCVVGGVGISQAIYAGYKSGQALNKAIPPPIEIHSKPDSRDSQKTVFTLNNVTAFSVDQIMGVVRDYTSTTDSEEIAAFDYTAAPKYSVELTVNNKVSLGEIDYAKWDEDSVVIKDDKGDIVTGSKKEAVLQTLAIMPKFLGMEGLDDPKITADQVMASSSEGILSRFANFIKGRGKRATKLVIDPKVEPSTILESDEFFDRLIDVAVETGQYSAILGNSKKCYIHALETSFVCQKAQKETEDHTNKIIRLFHRHPKTQMVMGVAATVFFGVLAILSAGSGILAVAAFAAFVFTWFRGLAIFNRWRTNRKLKKKEEVLEKKKLQLKKKASGLDDTTKNIERFIQDSKNEKINANTLSLKDKQVGDFCVKVVSKWLASIDSERCTELDLSGNGITSDGAKSMAEALKVNSTLRVLNLGGNSIGEDGLTAIVEALKVNWSLTELKHNTSKVYKDFDDEIMRQLLMNKFLQGETVLDKDKERYFTKKDKSFDEELTKKVSTLTSIPLETMQEGQRTAVSEKILKVLIQKNIGMILNNKEVGVEKKFREFLDLYKKYDISSDALDTLDQGVKQQLGQLVGTVLNPKKSQMFAGLSSEVLKLLSNLKKSQTVQLFEQSLAANFPEHKNNFMLASLFYRMLKFKGVLDLQKTSPALEKVRECIAKISVGDIKDFMLFAGSKKPKECVSFSVLEGLRDQKSTSVEESLEIDRMIQNVYQEYLKSKYGCLQGNIMRNDFSDLRAELSNTFILRDFVFDDSSRVKVEPRVINYMQHICARNRMYDAVWLFDMERISSQEGFEKLAKAMIADTDCSNSFRQIKEKENDTDKLVLKMIQSDLGKHARVGVLLRSKVTNFNCEKLRNLRLELLKQERADSFIALLEKAFSVQEIDDCPDVYAGVCTDDSDPRDVRQKAILVYELLGIDELFDPKNIDSLQDIIYDVYWSLQSSSEPAAYYNYEALVDELKSHMSKLDLRDQVQAKVQAKVEKALKSQGPIAHDAPMLALSAAKETMSGPYTGRSQSKSLDAGLKGLGQLFQEPEGKKRFKNPPPPQTIYAPEQIEEKHEPLARQTVSVKDVSSGSQMNLRKPCCLGIFILVCLLDDKKILFLSGSLTIIANYIDILHF